MGLVLAASDPHEGLFLSWLGINSNLCTVCAGVRLEMISWDLDESIKGCMPWSLSSLSPSRDLRRVVQARMQLRSDLEADLAPELPLQNGVISV